MKYLIADAMATSEFSPNAILIIPVTKDLTSLLYSLSIIVDRSIESLRPVRDNNLEGYILADAPWPFTEQKSVKSFRRLLLNELDENEFTFLEESNILNEGILNHIAERFTLTMDVLESSTIFQKMLDGTIEYTTYSIPLTCMPLSASILIPHKN
jgi:hypothetical protein